MNDYLPRLLDSFEYAIGFVRDGINGGTELTGEYALDEVDVWDLQEEINDTFGVELSEAELESAKTIGDIAARIERRKCAA